MSDPEKSLDMTDKDESSVAEPGTTMEKAESSVADPGSSMEKDELSVAEPETTMEKGESSVAEPRRTTYTKTTSTPFDSIGTGRLQANMSIDVTNPTKFGCKEHRDVGSQAQLEKLCLTVRTLALAARHHEDLTESCKSRAETLLKIFFLDQDTGMLPEVLHSQALPVAPYEGDSNFANSIRTLILADQALKLFSEKEETQLSKEVVQGMSSWLAKQHDWMRESAPGRSAVDKHGPQLWHSALVTSHQSVFDETRSRETARSIMKYFAEWRTAEEWLNMHSERSNRRHSLARPLPNNIKSYISTVLSLAKQVPMGETDAIFEPDEVYHKELEWFDRVKDTLTDAQWPKEWSREMVVAFGFP